MPASGTRFEPAPRSGVVAVIRRETRFLVIRRSQLVRAPGAFCFPGGGVEAGETDREALQRELKEELSAEARVGTRLWNNRTPSGIALAWYAAVLESDRRLVPNPAEVASIHWMTHDELRMQPGLLVTNHDFLAAVSRGEIQLES